MTRSWLACIRVFPSSTCSVQSCASVFTVQAMHTEACLARNSRGNTMPWLHAQSCRAQSAHRLADRKTTTCAPCNDCTGPVLQVPQFDSRLSPCCCKHVKPGVLSSCAHCTCSAAAADLCVAIGASVGIWLACMHQRLRRSAESAPCLTCSVASCRRWRFMSTLDGSTHRLRKLPRQALLLINTVCTCNAVPNITLQVATLSCSCRQAYRGASCNLHNSRYTAACQWRLPPLMKQPVPAVAAGLKGCCSKVQHADCALG